MATFLVDQDKLYLQKQCFTTSTPSTLLHLPLQPHSATVLLLLFLLRAIPLPNRQYRLPVSLHRRECVLHANTLLLGMFPQELWAM